MIGVIAAAVVGFIVGYATASGDKEIELLHEYHRGYMDGIKEGLKRGKPPKDGSAAR